MSALKDISLRSLLIALVALVFAPVVYAQEYEIVVAPFNSNRNDFGTSAFKDGVVFCSSRLKKKLSFDEDSLHFYTDMYFARFKANKEWTDADLFADELTDFLNEGPATFNDDFTVIYYTANIAPKDPTKRGNVSEYKLGILSAHFLGNTWVKDEAFPFNAPKNNYNVAHPCLAPGDSILYFSSNMPGGFGGMDIYKCIFKEGRWSQPINLGGTVNGSENELFPFLSAQGVLYFSSDRNYKRGKADMNIYMTQKKGTVFIEPVLLPYPINTEYDDFAYTEFQNENNGFISSNREELIDKIFLFTREVGGFKSCPENNRSTYCYEIQDTRILPNDSIPVIYEWDLGDGNKMRGQKIVHCYNGPGTYKIQLNIIDTLTNQVFYSVSQSELEIQEFHQPYILSNDTTIKDQPMHFYCDFSSIEGEIDKVYWQIDGGALLEEDSLTETFRQPGHHEIMLGVTMKAETGLIAKKYCSVKTIYVSYDPIEGYPKSDTDLSAPAIGQIDLWDQVKLNAAEKGDTLMPLYHIILAESETRIPFNSPFFSKTEFVVMEYKKEDGTFQYTIGNTNDIISLYPIFNSLRKSGYDSLTIQSFDQEKQYEGFLRTGSYIQPGNSTRLNIEFSQLSDIKFEYDSAEILDESKGNLDYLAAMLMLEENFELKIHAHTDSKGNHLYNKSLSNRRAKSVVDYFAKKGIDPTRLYAKGFAETQPIADNATDEGRAMNRRVEFIIVFNLPKEETASE